MWGRGGVAALACCGGLLFGIAGCTTSDIVAPVGRAPEQVPDLRIRPREKARGGVVTPLRHRVVGGDTLYSIAWRYGLDYRQLAAWNAISDPYTIYVGQDLRLAAGGTPRTRATRPLPAPGAPRARPLPPVDATAKRPSKTVGSGAPGEARARVRKASRPVKPRPRSKRKAAAGKRRWRWPAKGKVIQRFAQSADQGIEISGRRGQPVYAAAAGDVVYRGSGLIGYGQLIIVKHDARFLSAYAHNDEIFVQEGDAVKNGQRIASMGRSGTNRVKLHFEIRRDGKPVDPLRYLPR